MGSAFIRMMDRVLEKYLWVAPWIIGVMIVGVSCLFAYMVVTGPARERDCQAKGGELRPYVGCIDRKVLLGK